VSKHEFLTPAEAAKAFGVTTKTITKWANAGKLNVHRTLGNHRRFSRAEIDAVLNPPTPDEGE
jgi:excisionase family DNA binding protein